MPKATFFNIPEEKREKILDVIKGEFINRPYNEITTRDISKKAGISKGSFNQYFENKEDAYKFIYLSIQGKLEKSLPEELLNNYFSDVTLKFVREIEYSKYMSQEEMDFMKSIHRIPEKAFLELYHTQNKRLGELYKKEIIKLINEGKISNNINVNFAVYIWTLLNVNVLMYFRIDNDFSEIPIKQHDKMITTFIENFLLQRYIS